MDKNLILDACNDEQKKVVEAYYTTVSRFANGKKPIRNRLEEAFTIEEALDIVNAKIEAKNKKEANKEKKKEEKRKKNERYELIQNTVVKAMLENNITMSELTAYGNMRKKMIAKEEKEKLKKQIKMLQLKLNALK